MNDTIFALMGYISWTLVLLVGLAVYRTMLVLKKTHRVNGFKADGSNVTPFGERLTRAQSNCVESFVFIGGLMLLAIATQRTFITDDLAYILLAARLGQSLTHLLSSSVLAVQIRFVFFLAQVGICAYWLVQLFSQFSEV